MSLASDSQALTGLLFVGCEDIQSHFTMVMLFVVSKCKGTACALRWAIKTLRLPSTFLCHQIIGGILFKRVKEFNQIHTKIYEANVESKWSKSEFDCLTLETAARISIWPQGPLNSCYRAFNQSHEHHQRIQCVLWCLKPQECTWVFKANTDKMSVKFESHIFIDGGFGATLVTTWTS